MLTSLTRLLLLLAVAACLVSCGDPTPRPGAPSPRVISLAPNVTTMLFDMGLGPHVVGVDRYSEPPEGEDIPVVGEAINVPVEPVMLAKPDVIFAVMEPRHLEAVAAALPDVKITYFRFDGLKDVASAAREIGRVVDAADLGEAAAALFESRLRRVREQTATLPKRRVVYVLGYTQTYYAGRESFLNDMLAAAGAENALLDKVYQWGDLPLETVLLSGADVLICQTEPERAAEAKAYWEAAPWQGETPPRVIILTDPRWTQPSLRLADYTEQLAALVHPELSGGVPASNAPSEPADD